MKNCKKAYYDFHCSSLEVWIFGRNLYIAGTSDTGEEKTSEKKFHIIFLLTTNKCSAFQTE